MKDYKMTDTDTKSPSISNADEAAAAKGAPFLSIIMQYVKDFSIENPHAPESFRLQQATKPQMNIDLNVAARHLGDEHYELVLLVKAKAEAEDKALFIVELAYGGLFSLRNFPADAVQPALMIEGAHLLFPFARQVIADATSRAGFPPLLINPVDFTAMYRDRLNAAQKQAESATSN